MRIDVHVGLFGVVPLPVSIYISCKRTTESELVRKSAEHTTQQLDSQASEYKIEDGRDFDKVDTPNKTLPLSIQRHE